MTVSIGDLAQSFLLQNRSAQLRADIQTLSQEMTTGQTSDVTSRLGGDFTALSGLEHQLSVLDSMSVARADASLFIDSAQTNMSQLADSVGELGVSLLSVGDTPTALAFSGLTEQTIGAFEEAVAHLNGAAAGRALFSGTATNVAPLPDSDMFLSEIRTVVSGAATAAQLWSDLTAWFDDPSGYRTTVYAGSTESLRPMPIFEDKTVSHDLRADDPDIRNALRDLAAAALATDPVIGLPEEEQTALLQMAGSSLVISQDALNGQSAAIGVMQERIEIANTRQETERLTLQTARDALLSVDPYDAATQLEAAQFRLEALYSVTVRTSQLSLVNFLR